MLQSTRAAGRLARRVPAPPFALSLTQTRTFSRSVILRPGFVVHPARRLYSNSPYDKIDVKAEKEIAKKKIEPRPEEVSVDSSTRQVFEQSPAALRNDSVQDGLKHDLGIVQDTFELSDVPKQPYWLGLAGTLPYFGTSLATVYLSWDLNTHWPSSSTFINHIHMNHESAQYWLNFLEPVQLGYGAIIISFLGAVHWGMEYTAKTVSASRTNFRYSMGVLAPIVAWPTLFMPIEAALITQFTAFTGLYLADARATTRGWTPPWYTKYRFILTGIVGVAIFVSLVGRAKVGSAKPRLGQGLSDRFHEEVPGSDVDWAKLEKKEKEKNKKLKAEAERKQKKEEEEAAKKADTKDEKDQSKNAKTDNKSKKKEEGRPVKEDESKPDGNETADGKKTDSETDDESESKKSDDEKADAGADKKSNDKPDAPSNKADNKSKSQKASEGSGGKEVAGEDRSSRADDKSDDKNASDKKSKDRKEES
ncbi:hypothetical protein ACHAQA_000008 [Verticillium albo-atrum]